MKPEVFQGMGLACSLRALRAASAGMSTYNADPAISSYLYMRI